jgi:hypothetical protein
MTLREFVINNLNDTELWLIAGEFQVFETTGVFPEDSRLRYWAKEYQSRKGMSFHEMATWVLPALGMGVYRVYALRYMEQLRENHREAVESL